MSIITEEFRQKLGTLKGGRVDIVKNDETGIAKVVINHPEKRNCFTGEMMLQLEAVVADLELWPQGKGVLLHGAQGFFCSGGYLEHMKAIGTANEGQQMATLMHNCLTRFGNLPMLTATVIEGRALGGGAEITTASDFRLMARGAEVQFVHARMGIVPAWGGSTRLVRLLGPQRALDLLTSCGRLAAEEALKIGFVAAVLDGKDAIAEATDWLLERTRWPVEVVRVLKQTVAAATQLPVREAQQREQGLFVPLWGGTANKTALAENIRH